MSQPWWLTMGKCPPGLIQAVFFQLRLREIIPSSRMIRHMLDGRVSPGDPIDVLSRNATKAPSEAASFIPNGPEWMAVEVSQQSTRYVEQALGWEVSTPSTRYGERVEYSVSTQLPLDTLHAPSSSFDMVRRGLGSTPVEPYDTAAPSAPEKACARLIERAFALHELPSLIDEIFSRKDVGDTIRRLPGDGAQSFVDVIDETLDGLGLSLSTKSKCLKLLHRTCGHYAILPRSLKIPVLYDRTSNPLYSGGNSDVWKGEYHGRDVAVKVIRMYSSSDLQKIVGRFCKEVVLWRFLQHPNVLPLIGVSMSETRFAMVSDWMTNGNINEYVKAHPGSGRLSLLAGVTEGLIYLHSVGMVHGDLKGSNIMIDEAGHARLADFGLLTIISDPANLLSSSSCAPAGTIRWMSPELIYPEKFGFKKSLPTRSSDCYALGMVIYETISGSPPFYGYTDSRVALKVVAGEHPPRGVIFSENLWKMLESCWAPRPNDRPNIEDVLRCLRDDCDVLGSLHHSASIETRGTSASSLNDVTRHVFDPIPPVFRPSVTKLTSEMDMNHPSHDTHPDLSTSRIDSSSGGVHRDLPRVSGTIENAKQLAVGWQSGAAVPSRWWKIPQRCYSPRTGASSFPRLPEVTFSADGIPGINVQSALDQVFAGLIGRDEPVLERASGPVSCRLMFPGYPDFIRGAQIAVRSWKKESQPITRSKLAYEVAKRVKRYLDLLAGTPIDPSIDSKWAIGQGSMKLAKMYLVNLAWVSKGSVQPEIWVDTEDS